MKPRFFFLILAAATLATMVLTGRTAPKKETKPDVARIFGRIQFVKSFPGPAK